MKEKFYLKPLPKIEVELKLISTMLDVANYEQHLATKCNHAILDVAEEIMRNKVLELKKVLENPSRYDKGPHDDLID